MLRNDLPWKVGLFGLFAVLVGHSWLAWGDVDVDFGREMYSPPTWYASFIGVTRGRVDPDVAR
jgi:hypothetical protein